MYVYGHRCWNIPATYFLNLPTPALSLSIPSPQANPSTRLNGFKFENVLIAHTHTVATRVLIRLLYFPVPPPTVQYGYCTRAVYSTTSQHQTQYDVPDIILPTPIFNTIKSNDYKDLRNTDACKHYTIIHLSTSASMKFCRSLIGPVVEEKA